MFQDVLMWIEANNGFLSWIFGFFAIGILIVSHFLLIKAKNFYGSMRVFALIYRVFTLLLIIWLGFWVLAIFISLGGKESLGEGGLVLIFYSLATILAILVWILLSVVLFLKTKYANKL